MSLCEELPDTAHSLFVFFQERHRPRRPFTLDVTRWTESHPEIGGQQIRAAVEDLVDNRILDHTGDHYRLLTTCPHRVITPRKQRQGVYVLALRFDDRVLTLEPMGRTNTAALARHLKQWIEIEHVSAGAINLMINLFVERFPRYRHVRPATEAWKLFVSHRKELFAEVERLYWEEHQWERGFEESYRDLFGKELVPNG